VIETAAPVSVPFEPTTPIKPSEALRLGRLIVPTSKGGTPFSKAGEACAIGAMYVGYGGEPHTVHPGVRGTCRNCMGVYRAVSDRLPRGVRAVDVFLAHDFHGGDEAVLDLLESRGL
jgi:hypothetical protein